MTHPAVYTTTTWIASGFTSTDQLCEICPLVWRTNRTRGRRVRPKRRQPVAKRPRVTAATPPSLGSIGHRIAGSKDRGCSNGNALPKRLGQRTNPQLA